MSCVTRIQQCSVFGIHKPLETKTTSVEKDLIVEKCKANSSAVFWRLCFQTLMFYEWCLGTVEVARMWKEQTVQCQKQIMWLQVSLLAHHAESATRLRLEIPTRNIKLEIVLCWKQQGRGGTQPSTTAGILLCSQEGFKKAENQISRWKWSSKGTSRHDCSPLKTLSWGQLLTVLCCLCCPHLPPGFPRQQLLSNSDTPVPPAVPTALLPLRSHWHTGDGHSSTWSDKISGNLLPKPDSHRHMPTEESQKCPGMRFSVELTLAVLAYFWQRYSLQLLQQQIDNM